MKRIRQVISLFLTGLLFCLLFFIVIESFSGLIAFAQDVEIDYLIIDQTQTRIGHEFYRDFITFWEPPMGIKDYNIFISEKANARWGSWIQVEVGGLISKNAVYKKLLKPRSGNAEEEAKIAIRAVRKHFTHLQEYEEELGGGDLKGDGIS